MGNLKAAVPSPGSIRAITGILPGSIPMASPMVKRCRPLPPSILTSTVPLTTWIWLRPSAVAMTSNSVPKSTNVACGVRIANPRAAAVAILALTVPRVRCTHLPDSTSRLAGP